MRKLLLVFGALLVVSGIVSAKLWLELSTERQTNADLTKQLTEARIAARMPVAPAAPAQSPAPTQPGAVPDATVAATKPPAPPVDNLISSQAMAAAISAGALASATGSAERDLLKNPEYRKAQLTLTRLKLAQSNPGLAETLGLSEKEANHLFEVMAESQMKLTAELSAATTASGASSALSEVLRRANAGVDPVRTELGETKYAQYQEYTRNVRPALTQVASLGSTLSAAGQPLNASQSQGLTTAIVAEQQRQRQEAAVPRANPVPGAPRGVADSLAEYQKTQEDGNRRILEAAKPHLNSAQLEVLQKQFDDQAAQRRRTIETAKELDARRAQPQSPPARTP